MHPNARKESLAPLLRVSNARITAPGGRALFEGLDLELSRERVAVVGRNGVGKSTLLAVLSGSVEPDAGVVAFASPPFLVPQVLGPPREVPRALIDRLDERCTRGATLAAECARLGLPLPAELRAATRLSAGELRKLRLLEATRSRAEVLLLDEPSEDLDDVGVEWLRGWFTRWRGALVVVSHDRRLLADFREFFVVQESGAKAFSGSLSELDLALDAEHLRETQKYARTLRRLAAEEAHTLHVARRKARKKRYGRCSEIDRATPRVHLNQKRDHAQDSHGRLALLRQARVEALRAGTLASRRPLAVELPFSALVPPLPESARGAPLRGFALTAVADGRTLFAGLTLEVRRERVGVVGPNGAGKSTLLDVLLKRRAPTEGIVTTELERVGAVAQGGADWMQAESLVELLPETAGGTDVEVAALLVAHGFPSALAARPLSSLSPGERVRAALLCLLSRRPSPEILVLDEPTFSLDVVGRRGLVRALSAWRGGLLVASHDRAFLDAIGVERSIRLPA